MRIVVELPETIASISTDPDDDAVIQTARVGHADVLCTLDRHLRNPRTKARRYCQDSDIQVLTDVELLRELRRVEGAGS